MINANQYIDTQKWNLVRDNTRFVAVKEIKMLEEEKLEFSLAKNKWYLLDGTESREYKLDLVVEMVDAVCDYMFVYVGTEFKVGYNTLNIEEMKEFNAIKSVVENQLNSMQGILNNILGQKVDLSYCYQLVLEANNAKPSTKNEDDKVQKGTEWVDPKYKIMDYLISLGVDEYI